MPQLRASSRDWTRGLRSNLNVLDQNLFHRLRHGRGATASSCPSRSETPGGLFSDAIANVLVAAVWLRAGPDRLLSERAAFLWVFPAISAESGVRLGRIQISALMVRIPGTLVLVIWNSGGEQRTELSAGYEIVNCQLFSKDWFQVIFQPLLPTGNGLGTSLSASL